MPFEIVQSSVDSNFKVMKKMLETISRLGGSQPLYEKKHSVRGIYLLNAKGIENIFGVLFPLLEKYSHFLY